MTGVTFINFENESEKYHTADDFNLVLESKELTFPEIKRETVEIPYRDGVLDITGILTGEPQYNERTITLVTVDLYDRKHYSELAALIANKLFGKKWKIILDADPYHYYTGIVSIDPFSPMGKTDATEITLNLTVEPYKISTQSTSDDWLWDPFNFYTDSITDFGSITVSGTKTITIDAGAKSVSPTIICSSSMSMELGGQTFGLKNGTNKNPEIRLERGENEITFRGSGTVTIDFHRRSF